MFFSHNILHTCLKNTITIWCFRYAINFIYNDNKKESSDNNKKLLVINNLMSVFNYDF